MLTDPVVIRPDPFGPETERLRVIQILGNRAPAARRTARPHRAQGRTAVADGTSATLRRLRRSVPSGAIVSSSFTELGVPADLVAALARGIDHPSPIQIEAVPAARSGRDLCGQAPTGSGKTLAFALPLAERVKRARPGRPAGLVLVPTRELAAQVVREIEPLLAARGRRAAAVYGGASMNVQIKALRRGVDVLVACPGRLTDLIERGHVVLADVGIVVVDEADRMADMGFLPAVRRLLDGTPADRQTLLFSATLDGPVDALVQRYQQDPVRCAVASEPEQTDLTTHVFLDTERAERVAATARLIREHGSSVIFCRTRRGADRVAASLAKSGITAAPIHGGRSQPQRDRALAAFGTNRIDALVATDVAARGIHVDAVACVVHFDLPADVKDYVHRSGRTGRAGAEGVVVSLVTRDDRETVRRLRRHLGREQPEQSRRGPGRRTRHRGRRR
jgi:superfamily II DNA/RNA helicase